MNNTFWLVFEYGVNLLQGIMFSYFLCGCLKCNEKVKTKFIPFIINTVLVASAITLCNYYIYFEGLSIFTYSTVVFICAVLFFKGTIVQKIFVSIVPVNAMAIGSIFSTNLISYITKRHINDYMLNAPLLRVAAIIISNLVLFFILFIIKKVTSKSSLNLNLFEWLLLSVDLALSVVAYMFIYYAVLEGQSISANFFVALSAATIIIINISMYILLAKYSQRHKIETENKLLKQHVEMQTEAMQETRIQYDELSKIRHDFNNTLGVIQSLLETESIDKTKEYIEEYFDTQVKSVKIVNTGNSFLDAIISTKIIQAEKCGITVSFTTITDFETVFNVELCNLLGNMFDNAIAASKNSKKKTIYLDIFREFESISIRMKNSVDKPVFENNPNLITSKSDKENHGFGTRIIRETAEKIGGFADFYDKNGEFVCNVVLYI